MNTLTYALIIALISGVLLQWHLSARHIRHIRNNRDAVPDSFAGRISLEAHRKAADYNCAKTRVRLADLVVSSVLLLVWTLGGALDFLDGVIRSYQLSALWTGTVFILAVMVISALLDLPLSLYRTFGLEQRFGFNRDEPEAVRYRPGEKRAPVSGHRDPADPAGVMVHGQFRRLVVVVRMADLVRVQPGHGLGVSPRSSHRCSTSSGPWTMPSLRPASPRYWTGTGSPATASP